MRIENAIEVSRNPKSTIIELSEAHVEMSAAYYRLDEGLISILSQKPEKWTYIRHTEGVKSDSQADRIWEKTREGVREIELRHRLKALEKTMSAIKTRISVLQGEARNQY